MGSKISIDKHVSSLEDILEMNPKYFSKLKFENKIPDNITQHIKIWRFSEDLSTKKVKSSPISLQNFQTSGFSFLSTECYLVLLVYRKSHSDYSTFINFPHSLWGLVESYSNLTPRGLESPISSSENLTNLNKELLDSFLMPKRSESLSPKVEKQEYEYMLFVWNGKTSSPLIKSFALSNAFELENLINKGEDPFLRVLFSGGVITNKKLQKGTIIQLNTSASKGGNNNMEKEVKNMRETVYLFKFLFPNSNFSNTEILSSPESSPKNFKHLSAFFNSSSTSYESKFINLSSKCTSMPEIFSNYEFKSKNEKEYKKDDLLVSKKVKIPNLPINQAKNEIKPESKTQKLKIPQLNLTMASPIPNYEIFENEEIIPDTYETKENEEKIEDFEPEIEELKVESEKNIGTRIEKDKKKGNGSININLDFVASENLAGILLQDNIINSKRSKKNDKKKSGNNFFNENSFDERNSDSSMKRAQIKNLELNNIKMKIVDDNFMNINYWDIANEEKEGFNFDIRDTTRKFIKMQHFAELCSEIVQDLLYVGGETIAFNKDLLNKMGITHIINCAGDHCENKFPESFVYKTFHLKDVKTENIECIFYDCIFFIENVLLLNGKVLVHCVQGVSRSVTVCIAYLIYKTRCTYDEAFNSIKKVRGVASPNMGFIVQLLLFYKRLYESYDSIPVAPRIFGVSVHQIEQPNSIVARHLIEPLYNNRNNKAFDKRGIFIIQTKKMIYIWIGVQCTSPRKERFLEYAKYYIGVIQKYERAPSLIQIIEEGNEPKEFWQSWGYLDSEPPIKSKINKEWDNWYFEVLTINERELNPIENQNNNENNMILENIEQNTSEIENQKIEDHSPLLYLFPKCDEPLRIFDFEELGDDIFCILCKREEFIKKIFVWKGLDVIINEKEENLFIMDVIHTTWGEIDINEVVILKEKPNNETEEFMDCFQ